MTPDGSPVIASWPPPAKHAKLATTTMSMPTGPAAVNSSRGIEFELSRYPLVIIRFGSAYSSAEWNQMLLDLVQVIKRGPFVVIADFRNGKMPNSVQRRSLIDVYENHDRLTRAHFLALGGVGASAILGRIITALNWLRPAPHPVKVFATFDAAETWVLDHLPESVRQQVPLGRPKSNG